MSALPDDLPDDVDALKAMVANLREQLSSRAIEIEHLKLTIAKLRRMQFGRKSEKLDRQIEQLELRLEDLQADEGAAASAAAPKKTQAHREAPVREPLPAHLERDERVHLPAAENCPECGGTLKLLGEDVAEQLEYVRAHFRVIRHRRPKLACPCCDCIVQAAAPSRPIERGMPGPGLLAHVVASKFMYHVPFYRQSVMNSAALSKCKTRGIPRMGHSASARIFASHGRVDNATFVRSNPTVAAPCLSMPT